jgi:uncharacterized protein (UPF0147 family)
VAKNAIDRAGILRLAADAQLDPRTVRRAIEYGIESLKAEVDRDRLKAAANKLGLRLV